jgi:regulatory protein
LAKQQFTLTASAITQKIKHYCSYQERCHHEVRYKLVELGARELELENIIANLIQENILNEERYAILYAGSKFRQLGWGRIKIRQAMQQHHVSEYCIRKGLDAIDKNDYYTTCKKYVARKWESLHKEKNKYTKQTKVKNYLLQKGYEGSLIAEVMKELE